MDNLKVGVIHIYNFPVGLAPTTRIMAYCKGLQQQGAEVEILSLAPFNHSLDNYPICGYCQGGQYFHFTHAPKCKIPFLRSFMWIYKDFLSLVLLFHHVKKSHRRIPYSVMVLSYDDPWLLKIVSKFLTHLSSNIKIVAIADEYPTPIRHYLKDAVPSYKLNAYRRAYAYIHARILMTKKLQDFYDSQVCEKDTLLLSTIVDTDRFQNVLKIPQKRDYLCYMGNMELSKDNVDNIILAFNLIKDEFSQLDLHLYGDPSSNNRNYLNDLIHSLNLQSRVLLKGVVDYNSVPCILSNAKILVASQPDTKRAEGGFPTKLGEYFMTGVPSILTNVGEISNYVTDSYNAYLVPPSDPTLYAKRLRFILTNYDSALQVASNARQYIVNNYTSVVAGKKLCKFFKSI